MARPYWGQTQSWRGDALCCKFATFRLSKLWSLFDLPNISSTTAIRGGPLGQRERSAPLLDAQRSVVSHWYRPYCVPFMCMRRVNNRCKRARRTANPFLDQTQSRRGGALCGKHVQLSDFQNRFDFGLPNIPSDPLNERTGDH
jgi:hypothetical protein